MANMKSQCSAAGRRDRGCRGGGASGAAHVADRALWLPRRHGHGGGRDQFLRAARQCLRPDASGGAGHRVATCLARIDRLDGLNAPHLILGKILAQAYDTAAYKIAADDLLAAHKVDILFHALGAGVVMHDETPHPRADGRDQGRPSGDHGRYLHRLFGRRRSRGLGRRALRGRRRRRPVAVPLDDVPPQWHRPRKGGRRLADDSGADGSKPKPPARIVFRARPRSCGRSARRSSGG